MTGFNAGRPPENPQTDDIARWERAERRGMRALSVVSVLTLATTIALYVAGTHNVIGESARQWLALALLVVFLVTLWRSVAPTVNAVPVLDDVDLQRKTVDLQQNRWYRLIRILLLTPVFLSLSLIAILLRHRAGEDVFATTLAAIFVLSIVTAMVGTFYGPLGARRIVVDEVAKDHQMRAMRLGFVAGMSALCGLSIVGAWNAALLAYLLPLATVGVLFVSGVYFLYLQWRAM